MAERKRLVTLGEPILVRVEEAVRLLSLSKSMLYQLINRGDLRGTPLEPRNLKMC